MRHDPPVRKDGLCVVCLKPRNPERSRIYGKAAAELDPFCCTEHCRQWHETPIPYKQHRKVGKGGAGKPERVVRLT